MNKWIKIGGCSLNQIPLDWEGNFRRIAEGIAQAKSEGIELLCFPEMCISGYGCEDAFFSMENTHMSLEVLKSILPLTKDIAIVVGLPMRIHDLLYNVACFIKDGKILGFVPKQHLANDGIHYEARWFKEWDCDKILYTNYLLDKNIPIGDITFIINGVTIGIEICEDAWVVNRPAEKHYKRGVDIILNLSASHFSLAKTEIRKNLVVESSNRYSCIYVYVNLLGNEAGKVIYDGEILIANCGNLLVRNKLLSFKEVVIKSAIIDLLDSNLNKVKSYSFSIKDDLDNMIYIDGDIGLTKVNGDTDFGYDIAEIENEELEMMRAIILGLFDYLYKSKSKGFVISLSGGADSSACLVLCVYSLLWSLWELGDEEWNKRLSYIDKRGIKDLITCIYQGTENSSRETLESARELANELEVTFYNWNLESLLNGYKDLVVESIDRELDWSVDDIALQNIQARVRVPALWMIANIKQSLLIATSNRSEASVGYATMDGDTSGSISPIAGIDKWTLLKWLHWAESYLEIKALNYVNNLKPSAELRPIDLVQTDEKDLMPYYILDKIEYLAVYKYKSPIDIYEQFRTDEEEWNIKLKGWIDKFFSLWCRNQWKRERYAPSFHIDNYNVDSRSWCRFPILNSGYKQELNELKNEK